MSLGMRMVGWAARFFGCNPFDREWKKHVNALADTPPKAAKPLGQPEPGLVLNERGEIFRASGGLPVDTITMDPATASRVWGDRQRLDAFLQGEGVEPLSANGGRSGILISATALWSAGPYLQPGHFGDDFTGAAILQEVRSWIKQLGELDARS